MSTERLRIEVVFTDGTTFLTASRFFDGSGHVEYKEIDGGWSNFTGKSTRKRDNVCVGVGQSFPPHFDSP